MLAAALGELTEVTSGNYNAEAIYNYVENVIMQAGKVPTLCQELALLSDWLVSWGQYRSHLRTQMQPQ